MLSANGDSLKREMETQPHAMLHAKAVEASVPAHDHFNSSELRELLRNATYPVGTAYSLFGCLRVELHGFILTGCLDLRDLGSESNPLPSLTLVESELQGGMDWSNSYGRGSAWRTAPGFRFLATQSRNPLRNVKARRSRTAHSSLPALISPTPWRSKAGPPAPTPFSTSRP